MPEPSPAERLALLRQRWERDPKSRLFLQLAEEYRRAGRLSEAVRILESGLAHNPTYVAAQVVMGRCLLETGDMPRAVSILERAVALDPTQIVANRLLVEAYLGVENVGKARERLDLYRLINDRDVEIEFLEARIGAAGGVTRPILTRGRGDRDDRSGERRLAGPASSAAAASFERQKAEPPRAVAAAPASRETAALPGAPAPLEAFLAAAPAPHRGRMETPFGELHRPADARRIVAAIAAGGIFPVTFRSAAPPGAPVASRAAFLPVEPPRAPVPPVERSWSLPIEPAGQESELEGAGSALSSAIELPLPESPPVAVEELANPFDLSVEATPPEETAALPDTVSPAGASATLGSLYLAQGHLDDAEESFEAVLRSRPADSEARRGLDEVRRRKSEAAAAFFDELPAAEPDSATVVGGLTARKIDLLRQFMARMRRGNSTHVS